MIRSCCLLLAGLVLLGHATTASALYTYYSDRGDYLADLPGIGVLESFEDEPIDVQGGSRTIMTSSSDISFSGSSMFGVNFEVVGGRFATEGDRYLQVGFIDTSSVIFEFDHPILAFGIDVIDKNVNSLDGVVDDQRDLSAVSQGAEGNLQFWGVIATPDMAFTQAGFAGQGPGVPGDTFALDNIVYVSTIPEPATIATGVAAMVIGVFARRKWR